VSIVHDTVGSHSLKYLYRADEDANRISANVTKESAANKVAEKIQARIKLGEPTPAKMEQFTADLVANKKLAKATIAVILRELIGRSVENSALPEIRNRKIT